MSSAASSSKDGPGAAVSSESANSCGVTSQQARSAPLKFKFRNLAGDLHSIPITIGTSKIQADAETLATYFDAETRALQSMAELHTSWETLQVYRELPDAKKATQSLQWLLGRQASSSFCTLDQLTEDEKEDIAKRYGGSLGAVGDYGLESSEDGCYRLRSISNGSNAEQKSKSGTDSETTTGIYPGSSSGDIRSMNNSSSSSSGGSSSDSGAVKGSGNGGDRGSVNGNTTIPTSANVDGDDLLGMEVDDSLVLPDGIEMPAFLAQGENTRGGSLLEGEDADSGEEDVEEGPAQKKRKVMPDERLSQNESSIVRGGDKASAGSTEAASKENHNAEASSSTTGSAANDKNNREATDSQVLEGSNSSVDVPDSTEETAATPRIYFIRLRHIQKLVAEHLNVPYAELMGIVEERESAEPLCLTKSPFLEQPTWCFIRQCVRCLKGLEGSEGQEEHTRETGHMEFRAYEPPTEEKRWIPFYVSQNDSDLPVLTHTSTASSNCLPRPETCLPVEFRVIVMNFRWENRESSPAASEFLCWGESFFRKYCYSKEYLSYPHLVPGRPANYKISPVARFVRSMNDWMRARQYYHDQDYQHWCWQVFGSSLRVDEVVRMLSSSDVVEADYVLSLSFVQSLPPSIRNNKSVALAVLKFEPEYLELFSEEIRGDRQVVLAALDADPEYAQTVLSDATAEMQDDEEVVQHAVTKCRFQASFFSPETQRKFKLFCGTCMKFKTYCDQSQPRTHNLQPLAQYLESEAYDMMW